MGVVYKARQLGLNRTVALKMIRAGELASPAEVRDLRARPKLWPSSSIRRSCRFLRLAGTTGCRFWRSNTSRVAAWPRGWLDGRCRRARPPSLAEQLARAVQRAHDRGVLHRDLKPANVLFSGEGIPKIADFGLAKRAGADMTASGAVLGTPSYMAPEQAAGGGRMVGPTADIYGLGAILYECLTGRPPFRAPTSLETLEEVRTARSCAAVAACPAHAARLDDDLPEVPPEGPGPSLSHGRRACRRPPPFSRTQADLGSSGRLIRARLAPVPAQPGPGPGVGTGRRRDHRGGDAGDRLRPGPAAACSACRTRPGRVASPEAARDQVRRQRDLRPRSLPL